MKTFLKILGILFWITGVIWIAYIMGEVLSRTPGYNSLTMLIGPLLFHFVCMFLGGFFFRKAVQKTPAVSGQAAMSAPQQ